MKKILFSTLLTTPVFFAAAQNVFGDTSLKSLTKLDVGLQGVGFAYEPKISNEITIDLSAGAGGGYRIYEGGTDYEWSVFRPALYFMVTPKFYYNRKQRIEKGRRFQNNSGNYLGLRLKYTTRGIGAENSLRSAGLVNLHWGIQRPIGNQWIMNAHLGGGYAQDLNSIFGTIYPALELKFSYIFSKPAPR